MIETAAGRQARSGTGVSPNSSVIHWERRDSVTNSNPNSWAHSCATSSKREAGAPEIVKIAIEPTSVTLHKRE